MPKRRVDNTGTTDMEREEALSTRARTMNSESESIDVSSLGSKRYGLTTTSSHSPPEPARTVSMPSSLCEFTRQFEDVDAPDLARDAMTLFEAAWDGGNKHDVADEQETSRQDGIPLTHAIKRGSEALDQLMSDYIETVPAEITAMVGDAFDAAKFTHDARAALLDLKCLDFTKLGTVHYEHIYSSLDMKGGKGYGRSLFVDDLHRAEVRVVAKFCSDVVELTESLRKRNGRRIATDMAEIAKLNESRKPGFSFEEREGGGNVPSTAGARSVIVKTSGIDQGTRLIIHHSTTLSYLPNSAILLAYIKVENLIPGSTWRTVDGGLVVKDRPPLVYTGDSRTIGLPTHEFQWFHLFGLSTKPFLTPRMAAHIHNYVGLPIENEFTEYYLVAWYNMPMEALPFFRRSAEWRDDFYQCHTRIRMRLQNGHLPLPNCYGEDFVLRNIYFDTDENGDDTDDDELDSEDEDDISMFIKGMPPFSNDGNYMIKYDIVCNDKNALELHRHPSMWFHAFKDHYFDNHLIGPSTTYTDQPKITSYFALKAKNNKRS